MPINEANMTHRSVWLQTTKQSIPEENVGQILTYCKLFNYMARFEPMPLKDSLFISENSKEKKK